MEHTNFCAIKKEITSSSRCGLQSGILKSHREVYSREPSRKLRKNAQTRYAWSMRNKQVHLSSYVHVDVFRAARRCRQFEPQACFCSVKAVQHVDQSSTLSMASAAVSNEHRLQLPTVDCTGVKEGNDCWKRYVLHQACNSNRCIALHPGNQSRW